MWKEYTASWLFLPVVIIIKKGDEKNQIREIGVVCVILMMNKSFLFRSLYFCCFIFKLYLALHLFYYISFS